jgi:hypothetical protein
MLGKVTWHKFKIIIWWLYPNMVMRLINWFIVVQYKIISISILFSHTQAFNNWKRRNQQKSTGFLPRFPWQFWILFFKNQLNLSYIWVSTRTWGDFHLGDNCIVFENVTASIGDLMVAYWVYWQLVSRDAVKFSNTIQLSPF